MSQAQVAIIMGSQSDSSVMTNCESYLKYFGLEYEIHILSAHRTPEATRQFAMTAEEKGFRSSSQRREWPPIYRA
jgi:5-(carboxyamino)imidazole ribonucleotide mutase